MEHLTTLSTEKHLMPKFAILGYEGREGYYDTMHYFSYHNVMGEKLTAGMPLTKETVTNLFSLLKDDVLKFRFKGMLPHNLIYFDFKGGLDMVWFTHPMSRMLYFDTRKGIESGNYPLPKLLFRLRGNQLNVFAVHRKETLHDATPLYHAPLLNINGSGRVCMGNASLDYDGFEYYEDVMGFVEKQFFNSVFTETHHNQIVKGNIVALMKSMKSKSTFDDALLIPNDRTLNQLYEN